MDNDTIRTLLKYIKDDFHLLREYSKIEKQIKRVIYGQVNKIRKKMLKIRKKMLYEKILAQETNCTECPICFDTPDRYYILHHEKKHLVCKPCYRRLLKTKQPCPFCRKNLQ